MAKLSAFIRGIFLCVMAYGFPVAVAYAAPNLQFDQTNVTVVQNATFQEKININVDTNHVQSSDAIVTYAGADLEVTTVTNGGFFPEFSYANDPSGTLEIHGYSTTGNTITGNGTLASITFKAKKNSGSSTISYSCTGGTNSTNILSIAGQNILTCSQVNTAGITYSGGGTTVTLTPVPTNPPGTSPTSSPTPTPIPGGNTIPICASLYSDISSAVGTPLAVTFTCSGVDTDGYINAAEFVFGDGSSQAVQKNAGSPGSIATTHTFTTIGTLGVSCRVRDNNNVYSQVPDNCKKIVTIKQAPKTIAASSQTGSSTIRTTTPTPQIVTIISETPEPTLAPTVEPTPAPEAEPTGTNRFWWIVGGVIAIILAFVLLRRRPPTPAPPIPPMNPPTDVSHPLQPQV